jgi:hypothetical protein
VPHDCVECDDLKNDLHPFDSESVPDEVLDKHLWDLPLLSDDAKQYYLPAWIVRSIDDPESDYTQAFLFALDSDHRWAPTTPYTERQWRALGACLDYLETNVDELSRDDVAKARRRLKGEP